jgi:pimeloyl-ACP methyl ester carboxylesterase
VSRHPKILTTLLASGALLVAGASAAHAAPLAWTACDDGFQCATASVPLDYDEPAGPKLSLALIRLPAADPAHRIGTLFTNPGGPGNSGVAFVRDEARDVYTESVRARFDVVGFDPRGVGASTPVRCFDSADAQSAFNATLPAFPVGRAQEQAFAAAGADLGRRCRAHAGDLLDHLSTANVARDLDVLRAAAGDAKLTFAGHSYGSFLGATYANLFPQRVRAIVLDGVLDPVGWTTGRGLLDAATPFSLRVDSQRASSKALRYFLDTCKQAGDACAFSAGDPVKAFEELMNGLRRKPVELDVGDGPQTFTYADVTNIMRDVLGFPPGWPSTAAALDAVRAVQAGEPVSAPIAKQAAAAVDGDYDNGGEAKLAIACAETNNPRLPQLWPIAAAFADRQTPYFGASWAYISQACATWPGRDSDRYAGPFDRKTAAPLLLVNSRFDAAASYERAQLVERTLGRARLLTIEGAGHTQGTIDSPCADGAVERYLIAGQLPAPGAVCADQRDPWQE